MNYNNAEITISAVSPAQYPATTVPEIALAGRSNVGKSSFINKFLNRKSLARTSSKPGKTATLNFYNIDNSFFFVDLPGYGYAEVSKAEREKWAKMINLYLTTRAQLITTFLILDARHKPTKDDIAMYEWIKARHGYVNIIVTKLDKLKKSKIDENIELIKKTLNFGENDVLLPFSAQSGIGVSEARELVEGLVTQ
ncbi:MAG: YihA family ribosome biogenesis GTP-binding protein [Clostridia bacterium]|nr:YihA family ribosome biogenesis GTP-binding protein [Clostridia bacterium]